MLKNFCKYLFLSRPQSLGEGLARVKNKFNVVGSDVLGVPGQRIYYTPCNNTVHIATLSDKLKITKILSDQVSNGEYNKYYVGKVAEIVKSYANKLVTKMRVIVLDRSITKSKFTEIKPDGNSQFPSLNEIYEHRKNEGVPIPIQPQIKTSKCYNVRMISYPKAVAMGIKV